MKPRVLRSFYCESQKGNERYGLLLHLLVVRAFNQLHYKSLDQQAEVNMWIMIELKKGLSQSYLRMEGATHKDST